MRLFASVLNSVHDDRRHSEAAELLLLTVRAELIKSIFGFVVVVVAVASQLSKA